MKTLEEMAEEYADQCVSDTGYATAKAGFLAGYKAAKDQVADADKVICNTTMEEIKAADTGELMPATNLPTPAKWISVKDKLPENGKDVLISYGKKPFYKLAFLLQEKGIKRFIGENGIDYSVEYVTHWMPLPAPPKKEG